VEVKEAFTVKRSVIRMISGANKCKCNFQGL